MPEASPAQANRRCPTCGEEVPAGFPHCPRDGSAVPLQPDAPVASSATRDPLIGGRIDRYVIEARIGQGGMGLVYRGLDSQIAKQVAIKVLRPGASGTEEGRRLLDEARAVNTIRHRGIVDVLSFGELPDGRPYLVMELLEGEGLDRLIARSAPMTAGEAIPILDETLDALHAAHGVGVVHRDLKPSNIFLVAPRHGPRYVKLLDFGLSKQGGAPRQDQEQTNVTTVVGTPEYIAPEQACGLPVGPRTDLYALGVVAYEMVTGRIPFAGATASEIMRGHVNLSPVRPSLIETAVPSSFEDLVLRLLAKEPSARPESAAFVRSELNGIREVLHRESTNIEDRAAPKAPGAPRVTMTRDLPPSTWSEAYGDGASKPKAASAARSSTPAVLKSAADAVTGRHERVSPASRRFVLAGVALVVIAAIGLIIGLATRVAREDAEPNLQLTPLPVRAPSTPPTTVVTRPQAQIGNRPEPAPPSNTAPGAVASTSTNESRPGKPARDTSARASSPALTKGALLIRLDRLKRQYQDSLPPGEEPFLPPLKFLDQFRKDANAAQTERERRKLSEQIDAWEKEYLPH
jgi:serine/threonine protein kinase